MKKTFKQYLIETPLPDDWDSTIFDPRVPFYKRIKYAQEKAKKLGAGSSRVAFVIPYEGRDTVLKVAKNPKGIAQNSEELTLLEDWYLSKLELTIPLIDYDKNNPENPTWLHVELANKAKASDFKRETGVDLSLLIAYAEHTSGRKSYKGIDFSAVNEESELVQALVDFVGNYTHVPTGDLTRIVNWGVFQGRLVIIDNGLTDTSYELYKRR